MEHRAVTLRVLPAGHQRIASGQVCRVSQRPIFFDTGAVFACPAESAESYIAREMAEPLEAARATLSPVAAPDASFPGPCDREAVARLGRRAWRDAKTGCLVWQGSIDTVGYGQLSYHSFRWSAHRLSWTAHRGAVPAGLFVCHTCDNRACIAIEHLFLGTPRDNFDDMSRKGRRRGKLTPHEVAEIRQRLAAGESPDAIARDVPVHPRRIVLLGQGRIWRLAPAAPGRMPDS